MVLYCTLSFAKLANSSNASVTYPEFFWADRYKNGIHEGTTMVAAKRVQFQNCVSKCSKIALPGPVCS